MTNAQGKLDIGAENGQSLGMLQKQSSMDIDESSVLLKQILATLFANIDRYI